MAKNAHSTPTPKKSSKSRGRKLATVADYASIDFEPVPGLAESLGSRAEWLAKMGDRYPTMWFGAATMRMTMEEVTAMAAAQPEATTNIMECIRDLHEKLQAESEIMNAAFLRMMSGCCRAGLV